MTTCELEAFSKWTAPTEHFFLPTLEDHRCVQKLIRCKSMFLKLSSSVYSFKDGAHVQKPDGGGWGFEM